MAEAIVQDFSLNTTLSCGQAFRWEKNEIWRGVVNGNVIEVWQENEKLHSSAGTAFLRKYFRLDDDLRSILRSIKRDAAIAAAIKKCRGLRILRQAPFECLISYICSANANIPQIKGMIKNLCEKFGEPIADNCYAFPTPEKLAAASTQKIKECKVGFRAKYVREAARANLDFSELRKADYITAKSELMKLAGVGEKIADCVCLFSLEKLGAFPVDVWVRRFMVKNYGRPDPEFGRAYFGKYAGYAQEYIFCYSRNRSTALPFSQFFDKKG